MNLEDPTVVCFLTASSTAYKNCAVYTKNKFPLLNSTLKAFAALGPCMILSKKGSVMKYLIKLPELVSVLTEDEINLYELQVRKMMNSDDDIVKWYSHYQRSILLSTKWPCWYCPKVESRFSAMGDVIDKKANRVCSRTYSAIQTVKYSLRAQFPNCSSSRNIQLFKR